MRFAEWERATFDADGLTGERLVLRDRFGFFVGTVVVWPGRATRVYWPGGRNSDFVGRDSRSQAVRAVEAAVVPEVEAGSFARARSG